MQNKLHPRYFWKVLAEIDQQAKHESHSINQPEKRAAIALFTAAVCLLLLHYLKFSSSFRELLLIIDNLLDQPAKTSLRQLQNTGFLPLINYCWWGFWHILAYALIPIFVIKFILRDQVKNYGIRLLGLHSHFKWYALLCTPILCFVIIASFREDFINQYPFYRLAYRSWFDLFAWELIYLTQFVCLEFFFRGFFLSACKPAFGSNAIWVMCLPYLMIHFAKPWPEATGAIFFGLFLGVLALRSGSIWGGVLVHVTIASSMDLMALIQTGRLPQEWLP